MRRRRQRGMLHLCHILAGQQRIHLVAFIMLLHTGRSSLLHAASHRNLSLSYITRAKQTIPRDHPVQSSQRHICAAKAQVEIPAAVPVHPEIGEVLFSESDLHQVVARLGRQIGEEYKGKDLLIIGVLKGAFMFTSDLVRVVHPFPLTLEVEFLKASSYGSASQSSGDVKLDSGFDLSCVTGKHVLVVEDIMDTGLTLTKIVASIQSAAPESVRICTLLDKKARRRVPLEADFVGLQCPDAFIVGYGIDYQEKYRNLPYIGVPRPEFITS